MKVVALIPVKLNNERVPGKNLKCFGDGTPLIEFIQRTCLKSKFIADTYVYCSDERIIPYLIENVKYLKRPDFLDGNGINSNDIIREFIKNVDADIYVETHATGPFTKTESIDVCISKVMNNNYDSAFLARRLQEFMWTNGRPMNFDISRFPRTQDLEPIFSETPGAYVFTRKTFEQFGRRVGNNPYIHEVDEIESRDIDYPQDFDIANAIYMNIIKGGGSRS